MTNRRRHLLGRVEAPPTHIGGNWYYLLPLLLTQHLWKNFTLEEETEEAAAKAAAVAAARGPRQHSDAARSVSSSFARQTPPQQSACSPGSRKVAAQQQGKKSYTPTEPNIHSLLSHSNLLMSHSIQLMYHSIKMVQHPGMPQPPLMTVLQCSPPPPGFTNLTSQQQSTQQQQAAAAASASHTLKAGLAGAGLGHTSLGLLTEDYNSLLHTPSVTAGMSPDLGWMCNLKLWNESSSRKRSTSWLRPDYHITIDKKYEDMTYSELVCGMTCVLNRIRREKPPNLSPDRYLAHFQYVTKKGQSGAFGPKALARYDHAVVSKYLDGDLPNGFISGVKECVDEFLSTEHLVVTEQLNAKLAALSQSQPQSFATVQQVQAQRRKKV